MADEHGCNMKSLYWDGVWGRFFLLSLVWGTSFLFIKLAVEAIPPIPLVAIRLLIGWLMLFGLMRWQGVPLPASSRVWFHFSVLGVLGMALPLVLVAWSESGQQGIDSGLTAVLNSTTPLFTVVLTTIFLKQERVNAGTIAGLFIGFGGVLLLFSPHLGNSWGGILPLLAVVLATFFYAISAAYVQQTLHGYHPVAIAFGQLFVGDLILWLVILFQGGFQTQAITWTTVFSLLWLGVLGSGLAYVLFFSILGKWGATRSTLVTYVMPVIGVIVGVIFLNEKIDWRLIVGSILILSGVASVNTQKTA